jgi:hypothetical protein
MISRAAFFQLSRRTISAGYLQTGIGSGSHKNKLQPEYTA